MKMVYVTAILISLLVGGGGGVAFALASPETRELLISSPWWGPVVAGLVIGPLAGVAFGLWHRRRHR